MENRKKSILRPLKRMLQRMHPTKAKLRMEKQMRKIELQALYLAYLNDDEYMEYVDGPR